MATLECTMGPGGVVSESPSETSHTITPHTTPHPHTPPPLQATTRTHTHTQHSQHNPHGKGRGKYQQQRKGNQRYTHRAAWGPQPEPVCWFGRRGRRRAPAAPAPARGPPRR